jgi:hypothetical protein
MATLEVAFAIGDVVDVIGEHVRGEVRAISIWAGLEPAYLVRGHYPPGHRNSGAYCLYHQAADLAPVIRAGEEVVP